MSSSSQNNDAQTKARRIIKRKRRIHAGLGGGFALPYLFPGTGTLVGTAAMPVELMYVAYSLTDMCHQISEVYGVSSSRPSRAFLAAVLQRAGVIGARHVAELGVEVLTLLLGRYILARQASRIVPLVGIGVGAAFGWHLANLIGEAAIAEARVLASRDA